MSGDLNVNHQVLEAIMVQSLSADVIHCQRQYFRTVEGGQRRGRLRKPWRNININEWTGQWLSWLLRNAEDGGWWEAIIAEASLSRPRLNSVSYLIIMTWNSISDTWNDGCITYPDASVWKRLKSTRRDSYMENGDCLQTTFNNYH